MREIKFKISHAKNGEAYKGNNELLTFGDSFDLVTVFNDNSIKLRQYTGFTDVENVEIYDDDIVEYVGNTVGMSYPLTNALVYWNENGWFIKSKIFNWILNKDFCAGKIRIVGNIAENSELLTP